jgi:NAD(P)H-hydrate repair Nnr-like enzyme with NAD(P)H-hydrate epimerase domain
MMEILATERGDVVLKERAALAVEKAARRAIRGDMVFGWTRRLAVTMVVVVRGDDGGDGLGWG